MTDISCFIDKFIQALQYNFKDRVCFIGLQGSHARGEATESSDIDTVVILDKLSAADIRVYNAMLDTLPERKLICGFISGKSELINWEPSDLFQFYYDTVPIKGSLDELLPLIDDAAVNKAIKTGACNIYHGCVHNMLHEKSEDILRALYKSASFVMQAVCYKRTGRYVGRQADLLSLLSPEEQVITDCFLYLKSGGAVDFGKMSEMLFEWSGKLITNVK